MGRWRCPMILRGLTVASAAQLVRVGGKTVFVGSGRTIVAVEDSGGIAHLLADGSDEVGGLVCDDLAAYWSFDEAEAAVGCAGSARAP